MWFMKASPEAAEDTLIDKRQKQCGGGSFCFIARRGAAARKQPEPDTARTDATLRMMHHGKQTEVKSRKCKYKAGNENPSGKEFSLP